MAPEQQADYLSEVVLEALQDAYKDIHQILDNDVPDDYRLSRTSRALGLALRAVGSSGAQALGLPDSARR